MPCCWTVRRVGNIRVLGRGTLCLGPDYAFMVATASFILIGAVLFLVFTDGLVARILCAFVAAVTLSLMWRCSTMDPGICPKADAPPEGAPLHEPLLELVTYIDGSGQERKTRVERKWCYGCNNYRPLRAVHCRFCDACITRRDHHCPWVGTCVGERNYRFYWGFLWAVLCLTLTVMIGGVASLVKRSKALSEEARDSGRSSFLAALAETHFVEPLLVLVAFLACCLVAPLTAYHTLLVARNMTTVEEMRGNGGWMHYFNRGGCWENTRESLFSPVPPSMFATEVGLCEPPAEVVVEAEELS
ncbi:DHHC containing zinc finger protein [Trypanosoma grayi]|uniref:DHHC containing zinc finger protein n=1 Tax=Trypanosoma grayi TaxID=71804 RepID=UPI0004F45CAF|nr:DHHC containing zinc finger protein [Trypanosoma grayi]KEG13205.1 DHHC containing zinc finger protein [Trypanosoma grayi]